MVLPSSTNAPGLASNPSGPGFESLVACKRTSKVSYGSPSKSLPSRQGKDGNCLDGTEWVSLTSLSHARHGLWHPASTQQTSVDPVSIRHTIANSRNTIQTSLNEKWLPHLGSPCAAAGTAESRSSTCVIALTLSLFLFLLASVWALCPEGTRMPWHCIFIIVSDHSKDQRPPNGPYSNAPGSVKAGSGGQLGSAW